MKIIKFIGNIALTVIIACVASWSFYNFAPINLFHATTAPKPGAAFTTLVGSNVISNFPTTYNANLGITANTSAANTFTGLQTLSAGFVSQASSTVVGNFTSSATGLFNALNLVTPLTTANGGTGSTTLASNQVLLGNSTGNIGIVAGLGTSGQFLTSNGSSVAPTWQSATVNQTLAYTWTGLHTFNTGGIIDNASSTFTTAPHFSSILSSILKTDSTGLVSGATAGLDYAGMPYSFATSTGFTLNSNNSATPIYSTSTYAVIPNGFMQASSTIRFYTNSSQAVGGNAQAVTCTVFLKSGNNILATLPINGAASNGTAGAGWADATVLNQGSLSSQIVSTEGVQGGSVAPIATPVASLASSAFSLSGTVTLNVVFESAIGGVSSPGSCTYGGYTIIVTP